MSRLAADHHMPDRGSVRQRDIFIKGLARHRPVVPVDPARLEQCARRVMSAKAYAYMAGGAGAERTIAANRAAFDHWRIVPRVLRDASRRDMHITLFGERLATPVLLAPIGVLELAHRAADLAVARAAAAEGIPMIFSCQASVPMETCAAVMGEERRWFQLYWSTDDDVVVSFLRRAEACGCQAIVLTVDTTLLGWRTRDLQLGALPFLRGMGIASTLPIGSFGPRWSELVRAARHVHRSTCSRSPPYCTRFAAFPIRCCISCGPAPHKRRSDASSPPTRVHRSLGTIWPGCASKHGFRSCLKASCIPTTRGSPPRMAWNGIVVSNHGGRQVDGALGVLEASPAWLRRWQGGCRCCSTVVYGLALAGQQGVQDVIRNVLAELDLTMGLSGYTDMDAIGPHALVRGNATITSYSNSDNS